MKTLLFAAIACAAVLSACSEDAVVEPPPTPVQPTTTVRDLAADTAKSGHYTFFRLRDSTVVPYTDSASASWDIAFNATSIITNGGDRGPGQGGSLLLASTDFDAYAQAPESGYAAGDVSKDWYTYTGATGNPPHTILANTTSVLVVKTADGKYAKLQIKSYYKGAPSSPTGAEPSRFYTFRYFYQPDGSRKLTN